MRRSGLLAAALFLALAGIALHETVLGDRVLSSAQYVADMGPFPPEVRAAAPDEVPLGSDSTAMFEPWARYAADRLRREGRLPLWNDTELCGAPLLGNGQSALLHPANLLSQLAGAPPRSRGLLALVRLVVGALSAWLLARHLRLSHAASLLAGVTFGFYGFQASYLLYPLTNVSSLLPLLVLATDRLAQRPTGGGVVAVAAVCALQHLGGHPETAFHAQAGAALLGLVRVVAERRGQPLAALLPPAATLAGAYVLGAVLGAPQILPLLEYLRLSDMLTLRAAEGVARTLRAPWHAAGFTAGLLLAVVALARLRRARSPAFGWAALLFAATAAGAFVGYGAGLQQGALSPLSADWIGGPSRNRLGVPYVGAAAAYAGPALALTAAALLFSPRRGLVRVLAAVAALSLLVGQRAPVLYDLLRLLPLFDLAANERLVLAGVLAVAVLAALGLDALAAAASRADRLRLLATALAPALGIALATAAADLRGTWPVPKARPPDRLATTVLDVQHRPLLPERAGQQPFVVEMLAPAALDRAELHWLGSRAQLQLVPLPPRGDDAPEARRYRGRVAIGSWRLPSRSTPVAIWALDEFRRQYWNGPEVPHRGWRDRLTSFPVFPSEGRALPQALLFVAAAGAAAWALGRRGRAGPVLLVSLAVGGTWTFVHGLNPTLERALHYPPSPAFDVLAAERPDARVVVFGHNYLNGVLTHYEVPSVLGYDALFPRHVARLLREALDGPRRDTRIQQLPRTSAPDLRLLGLMGVRLLGNWRGADLQRVLYEDERGLSFPIAVNPHHQPRARLLAEARVVPDDEQVLHELREPAFDPARHVLLSSGTPSSAPGEVGTAEIELSESGRVVVRVDPLAPCHLVLSDTDFPGWTAFVDGVEREILRANLAFRAVPVRPGDRVVEFRYEPHSLRRGLALLAGGALLCVALVLSGRRRAAG